jgi:putative MATE family efflux protein
MDSKTLGTGKVSRLIFDLGWPGALNFLVVTIYNITDIAFAGRWLGTMQIAAVVIVGAVILLFSSVGLAIGVGGSSVIGRALGEKNKEKAGRVFANQVLLGIACGELIVLAGWLFRDPILRSFGAYGDIFAPAGVYYRILLFGVPLLSLTMMGNNVIQAQGKARMAMFNSLLPTLVNLVLNPVFIKGFHMGIEGSAWATMIGFIVGLVLVVRFFTGRRTEVVLNSSTFRWDSKLVLEIAGIGGSMLINVIARNVLIVALNKFLFEYQKEVGVIIYSIVNRVCMIFLVPIFGIDSGIRPIISYNFGSRQMTRIREAVNSAIKYGVTICYFLLVIVFVFEGRLIRLFTNDPHVVAMTLPALKIVLSFFPLFIIEVTTVTYFQAIGRPRVAFVLTLLRNIILLIPLLYLLSRFFGYSGILYAFPTVDILITLPAFWLLKKELYFKLPARFGAAAQLH